MTTHTVPLYVVHPNTGEFIPMPGNDDYVPGTDVSDALWYWFARTILSSGYTDMSGSSSSSRNTVLFQPDETYWCEYGVRIGAAGQIGGRFDDEGRAWQPIEKHAWRHVIFDGQGARLYSEDSQKYDPGLLTGFTADVELSATVGTACVHNITPPLSPSRVARIRSGASYVAGYLLDGTKNLFAGAGANRSKQAGIASVSDDGTEIVISVGRSTTALTGATIEIDVPTLRSRRINGFDMIFVGSPVDLVTERDCMSRDLTFRNFTIQGSNIDRGDGVATLRNDWMGFRLRACDGVTVESSVRVVDIWGDALNTGNDSGGPPENVTFSAQCNVAGRHGVTDQGSVNLHIDRAVFGAVQRWGYDSEPTNTGARMLGTRITNSAFSNESSLWTTHPPSLFAEAPFEVSISQGPAADQIVVPYDWIDRSDCGSRITGTGIPDDTFLWRRLSPTLIEVSQDVNITGTITAVVSEAAWFRNHEWDRVSVWSGSPQFVGSTAPRKTKVYFTGTLTSGSPVITDVVFDTRVDGLTFTTADAATRKVWASGLSNQIAADTPLSVTSTTITMPTNAKATVAPTTYSNCTWTANSRVVTSTLNLGLAGKDKGRIISGAGIPDGLRIEKVTSGKSFELNRPASASGTGTLTASGCALWLEAVPGTWGPFTIRRVRNIGNRLFGGNLTGYTNPGAPQTMLPELMNPVIIEECMSAGGFVEGPLVNENIADVTAFTGTQSLKVNGLPDQARGTFRITTTTGTAMLTYDGKTTSPNRLLNVDHISGTGALTTQVDRVYILVRKMVGHYTANNSDYVYGAPADSDWTISNNLWQDAIDNQQPVPTKTASIVLSGTGLTTARPTFTAVVTFSDAVDRDGEALAFFRNGVVRGVAIIDGDTATFTPWTDSPTGLHSWTARWGNGTYGSFDTLTATSNAVVQNVGNVSPTATTTALTPSPASPTTEGTTVTLTAVVTPTPDGGDVIFRDGTTTLATVALTAGTASTDATFAAGGHDLVASYVGTAFYAASFDSETYVSDPDTPADTTPPDLETWTPTGTHVLPPLVAISWTFDETVTSCDVTVQRASDLTPVVGTVAEDAGTWTFTTDETFAWATDYEVVIDNATDVAGNVAGRLSWEFTTAPRRVFWHVGRIGRMFPKPLRDIGR